MSLTRRAGLSLLASLPAACRADAAPSPDDRVTPVITPSDPPAAPDPPAPPVEPTPVAPRPALDDFDGYDAEPQIRAFWVDAFHDGVKTPAQVDALIRAAQRAHANTLIVQVRRRGDAYYSRTAEPRTEDPALAPGFDALQAVIDRAHAARPRLEVHAWIATVALWNNQRRPPRSPTHAFNGHGLASTGATGSHADDADDAGSGGAASSTSSTSPARVGGAPTPAAMPDVPAEDTWLSLDDRGRAWDGDNYMLDPGHPAATRYIAGVAEELTRAYAVDGIHLDLVRYAGTQWGYNPTSLARFRQRHAPPNAAAAPHPADQRWQQWRRDQVTALVRRVYLDCLAVRPSIKVTAAVIGWGNGPVDDASWRLTSAYRNVFQDWKAWLEEGIVDVIMPMNYDDEANAEQRAWFDRWLAWQREHQGKRQVAAGVGLFLNTPAAGLAQLRRALAPSPSGTRLAGAALYSYAVSNAPARGSDTPQVPNDHVYALLSGEAAPFSGTAPVPRMPWKDQPPALLRGTATADGQPLDGATVRLEGGPTRAILEANGNGYFGAPDLPPGTYTAHLIHNGIQRAQQSIRLGPGQVTTLTFSF